MDFKLKFNCDNAAFWAPELETSDILKKLADKVESGQVEGIVLDHNGNNIGKWEFTDI